MELKDAYKEVLKDIISNGPEMFVGKYDARNGKPEFMYGVSTVMEWIAYRSGDKYAVNFIDEEFVKNMIKSQKKALQSDSSMV